MSLALMEWLPSGLPRFFEALGVGCKDTKNNRNRQAIRRKIIVLPWKKLTHKKSTL